MADEFCPNCGAEHGGAKFCPECGTKIGGESVPDTGADHSVSEDADVDGESSGDGGLNITLGKIVGYIMGPILIFSALGGFIGGNIVSGILFLIAGSISLPIVRAKLKDNQGIGLSRWATVGIVLVLVIAGGVMVDTSGGGGAGPADSGGGDQTLIEKPATDIVLQLDQMGSGWTKAGEEGNETHAEAEFFRSEDSTYLGTVVDKYESTEAASDEYESREAEIEERYGTDSVNVGNEGLLYSIDSSVWVVYRYSNIVVEVQYQKDFAFDPDGQATDFAEMVQENANS